MYQSHDLQADLELALRAAQSAGAAVLGFFGRDTPVEYKSPDQPVTEADLLANRILQELLVGERPDYGWLSEETADSPERHEHERIWIVDPIDGTRSFIDGYAEYAISVGLAIGGTARLGVVLNPSTGETYHAVLGGGAYLNGEPIGIRARVNGPWALLASRSEIRRGEFEAVGESWTVQPLGSTAYKMVKVADGTGAGYLSRGPKSEWDVCASSLIVTESGGTVSDLGGSTLRFNQPDPFVRGIIAADRDSHEKLLRYAATFPRVERGRTGEAK